MPGRPLIRHVSWTNHDQRNGCRSCILQDSSHKMTVHWRILDPFINYFHEMGQTIHNLPIAVHWTHWIFYDQWHMLNFLTPTTRKSSLLSSSPDVTIQLGSMGSMSCHYNKHNSTIALCLFLVVSTVGAKPILRNRLTRTKPPLPYFAFKLFTKATANSTISPTTLPTPTTIPSTSTPTTKPPTKTPTKVPSKKPTKRPTRKPSRKPTVKPSSRNPTTTPTLIPTTTTPTIIPTTSLTTTPTTMPNQMPSIVPSTANSTIPLTIPSVVPFTTLSPSTTKPTINPTINPTNSPTNSPTKSPTNNPTNNPTNSPTNNPTNNPTNSPTNNPTNNPTNSPTNSPTNNPTYNPTITPVQSTASPTDGSLNFLPGNFSLNLRSDDSKVHLSNGLSAKIIAKAGTFVDYVGGGQSQIRFHIDPDGAAVIPTSGGGGWYYVSNAEEPSVGSNWYDGGVGSIRFNSRGEVIDYRRVANSLRNNCSGGKTPWNSWMTCEEISGGKVWQVDPTGATSVLLSAMGSLGFYESFAYDIGTAIPTFYVTRDASDGVLTRFTPNAIGMECYRKSADLDRWCTLNHGTVDYLLISGGPQGTFQWTTDYNVASSNANTYFPNNEGIDISNGTLYFVSKVLKRLIILDLRLKTYTYSSTVSGAFSQQPDQVARLLHNDSSSILYFCEDGGLLPGVYGRNSQGQFFTILYGSFGTSEETTGLAFSPDGMHMYVSFQHSGGVYDITRLDGLRLDATVIDIKYHAT